MLHPEKIQKIHDLKIVVSPLQWGVTPGNIRFSLTSCAGIPVGGVSIGGMAAYRMQKLIVAAGPLTVHAIRGGALNNFVLTEIQTAQGFRPWKEAVFAEAVVVALTKISTRPVELPASRRAVAVAPTRKDTVVTTY
jgi:hypothetical protein